MFESLLFVNQKPLLEGHGMYHCLPLQGSWVQILLRAFLFVLFFVFIITCVYCKIINKKSHPFGMATFLKPPLNVSEIFVENWCWIFSAPTIKMPFRQSSMLKQSRRKSIKLAVLFISDVHGLWQQRINFLRYSTKCNTFLFDNISFPWIRTTYFK